MASNELTDMNNQLKPLEISTFKSDAITDLINKQRKRLFKAKENNRSSTSSTTGDSQDEGCSPPKIPRLSTSSDAENGDEDPNENESITSSSTMSSILEFVNSAIQPSRFESLEKATNVEGKTKFATVCGRLSLLTAQKYPVTIGEMARRVYGSEEFSFSLLGGLLRRAKTPNSTNILKSELEAVGIQIERGRRRNSPLTLFGGITEAEATQLGKDFSLLVTQQFPSVALGNYAAIEKASTDRTETLNQLKAARTFVNEFVDIISKDASPVCDLYPPTILPSSVQDPLTKFSMVTHGFGAFAVTSVMKMYREFLDTQITALSEA